MSAEPTALNTQADIAARLREKREAAASPSEDVTQPAVEPELGAAPQPAPEGPSAELPESGGPPQGAQGDGQEGAQGGEDNEGDAGAEDALEISNLGDLAAHLGVDPAELYKISVPMTGPDGQRVDVTLGDWKDGYRAHDDMRRESEAAKQARAQALQEAEASRLYTQQFTDQMQAYLQQAEALLGADESAVNWEELREADPAEFTAKKFEIQERRNKLSQIRDSAVKELRERQAAEQQQQMLLLAQTRQREEQALLAALPSWREETTGAAEKQATTTWLESQGFTTEEIGTVIDHRLVVMADKARRFDELTAKTGEITAQVPAKSGKKVIAPGARRTAPKEIPEQRALADAQAALKRSGKPDDVARVLAAKRALAAAQQSQR